VSDASPSWRDSGHSKGYLHFSPFPTETAERKSSKKCRNVTDPTITMVVRKAFFDVGHSERPFEKPEKAGWEIHGVMKIDPKDTQFSP
jgi:hypothetical protein